MAHDTRKSKILLRITALGCVLFLALSAVFVFRLYAKSHRQSLEYLYDATRQTSIAVTQQIETNFQILHGVALSFGEAVIDDKNKLQTVLGEINTSNVFFLMGLVAADGTGFLVDLNRRVYDDIDMSGYAFCTPAMAGREVITDTFYDDFSGQYVNYYAVPVTRAGLPIGVLCAANKEEILAEPLSLPAFRGSGYYAILDKTGRVAGPAVAAEPALTPGAALGDIAVFQPDERALFDEALRAEGTAQFSFAMHSEKKTATLQYLGINDWFLLSVVPTYTVESDYSNTVFVAAAMVLAACCILGFLLLTQRRTLLKNQRQLEHLAYTDPLTARPNYTKFRVDAEKLLEKDDGTHYTIWSFDIKQFRHLNDILGYHSGDALLVEIAEILSSQKIPGFLFCHVAADDFAGMLPWQDIQKTEAWFSSLAEQCNRLPTLISRRQPIHISMGAYRVFADDGHSTVSEILNRANIAKQFAKEKIGSHISFFRIDIAKRLHRENMLESAAKAALEKGEFLFYLQPKVDIREGCTLCGAEALARWDSPALGMVSPAEFIPLFEKNGFVVDLDRFIFEQVCRWYSGYLAAKNKPIYISVNVSRLGFLREDFVQYYTAVKEKYRIPSSLLELELTESVVLEDYALYARITHQLQQNGFLCSIDDFGSGYSSLNVLKNLPVNIIKLDAVFFQGSEDIQKGRIVISYFIRMANALGIRTVAEGIEAAEQVDFLRRAGCDVVQGYIFSKPLPKEDFERFAQTPPSLQPEQP